jgi:hypothetical protein
VKIAGRTLTYLRLVESYREDGRVKHRIVKHLGREDQIDPTEIDRLIHSLSLYGTLSVGGQPGLEFGSLHALNHVWSELGLSGIVAELALGRRFAFDVGSVVKAIVYGRVLDPSSERALVTSWLSRVHAPEFEGIELQHAYRTLPFLAEVGPELETRLAGALTEKLFADGSLVLFDVTSTCFEGIGPEGLASFGYSRDKRSDRPQVNLALLNSREGYPLSHWGFPGRQADAKSMQEASKEFRPPLTLGSFVVVSDRGTIGEANLERLRDEGIEYIIAERLRRKTTFEALARAGRYTRVTGNLEVKEVNRDGKDRVILCRNQERAEEDARKRRDILEHLTEQLEGAPGARASNPPPDATSRSTAVPSASTRSASKTTRGTTGRGSYEPPPASSLRRWRSPTEVCGGSRMRSAPSNPPRAKTQPPHQRSRGARARASLRSRVPAHRHRSTHPRQASRGVGTTPNPQHVTDASPHPNCAR